MIKSLTGVIDGQQIIFAHSVGDEWTTVVPHGLNDGLRIIELTATDTAGNQGYYTAELWIWQGVITDFRLIEPLYRLKLFAEQFTAIDFEKYHVILHEWGDEKLKKHFMLGERKFVNFEVTSKTTDFIITSATYELSYNGTVVESGDCEIDGHEISVLLTSPDEKGTYIMKVFYEIPPEIRGIEVVIEVD